METTSKMDEEGQQVLPDKNPAVGKRTAITVAAE